MSGSRSRGMAARVFVLSMSLSLAMSQVVLGQAPAARSEGPSPVLADRGGASVEAGLLDKLRSGDLQRFMVDFEAKADLGRAWTLADHSARGQFVVNRLHRAANDAQAEARAIIGATKGASFRSFFIRNSMLVTGDAALAERLAQLDGVASVRSERRFPLVRPVREKLNVRPTVGAPEWGVDKINADEVWADGIVGTGVVVGNIDTGVDYLHEALADQYRGNDGGGSFTHDYNWWDPTDICGPEPCDNALHGTHTMGTMVGGDGPGDFEPDIGVAPGAQWIAAKGCEDNFCSEFALLSSGEFMLAPTDLAGENPDPDMRPHVLNNSWGGGPFDDWYLDIVTAWRASGIIPVFSSGNPGPECGFGGSPGDYLEAFSAGATDIDDVIAGFSGRGPSEFGKINPDISAPGVEVVSSIPGDEYAAFDGTSMAAPHASGTLALMLSAAPALEGDFEAATSAVRDTAIDILDDQCGGEEDGDPNNVYGDGRIDAQAAVLLVATGGTLTGIVTDALSGEPLPGAEVTAVGVDQDYTGFTDAAGVYELFVQEGEYDVTASIYGYAPSTANDVDVVQDEETVVDFELDALPAATVSGTVTDGSGHGWPLYARIDIDGYPFGPVFTDPVTGEYSVELVQSTEFTFHVGAVQGAYVDPERVVGPLAGDATEDFALAVDVELCDAPGYEISVDGLAETFSSGELPDGWTIVDNAESGQVWAFDDPAGRGNLTGAAGGFATVDSDNYGPSGFQDTELISPVIDLTTVDAPQLRFATDYLNLGDTAEVDVSIDGGETWDNLLSWDEDVAGPHQEIVDMPAAANQAEVQVRFHYFDAFWAWWWQVDHVIIGGEPGCDPAPGGLLVGNVYDGLTGLAINGASVTSDDDATVQATTGSTPEDENLDDGFYLLFSPMVGESAFTASASQYTDDTELPVIVADGVVRQDFELGAGLLVPDPGSIEVTLPMGGTTSEILTINNDGTAEATFELRERSGGREILSLGGAPAVRRSGTFSPHSMAKAGTRGGATVPGSGTDDAPWTDVAAYPSAIMDSTADAFDGLIYSVGGFDGGANLTSGYVYDPGTGEWSPIADMAEVREKPAAAFVDGLLYVLGGWDDTGFVSTTLEIYDPASDSWSTGAEAPAAYAAGTAVALDGLLYVIGGCTDFCGVTDVLVYDPGTDEWSFAAPYPEEVSWTHCGSIEGGIVCAGGVSDSAGELDTTYAYDPGTDEWTQLASMPQTRWAGGFVASDGLLIVSGGVTNDFATVTNEGFAYDPATDSWSDIPNSNNTLYRGASACGFYKIGGSFEGFDPTDAVELLPDTDVCGVSPDVTWLSEDPMTDTVAAGGSTEVTVSFDAGVPEVDQPGTYQAMLTFKEDTPYAVDPVMVTMNVTPPADWGKLQGTVKGLERCDAPGGPLSAANVTIFGQSNDFDLKTDGDGVYEWWMPAANGPVALSVDKSGWVGKDRANVGIVAGEVTTSNFTLRLDAPCASTSRDGIDVTLLQNDSRTLNLFLENEGGAAGYRFTIDESDAFLRSLAPDVVTAARGGQKAAPVGPSSARSIEGRSGTHGAAPASPPWFGANDIPGGLVRFGHAQCDGDRNSIYVVGGVDGAFGISNSLWHFDAVSTEWTELAPIPEGTEGPAATCDAGKIHVLGGGGTDLHFVYDIASDTWTEAAPLPRPVWGAAAGTWDGYVFLAGGDEDFFFGGTEDRVDVYDTVTDTWIDTGRRMPIAASAAGFVQSENFLYVVGGWDDSSPDFNVGAVQRYNMATDRWTVGPWLNFPRADLALAVTNTALYAIGGDEDGGTPFDPTRTVERLALKNWPDGNWSEIDRLGVPLTMNNGGFCTTGTLGAGTEIWSSGGLDGFSGSVSGRMFFRQVDGEKCTTYRTNLGWLSTSRDSGNVGSDGRRRIEVKIDADDLAPGEHVATLLIATGDPGHAEMRVPIHVTVVARPVVAYLSLESTARLDGVRIRNEDVFIVHDDQSIEKYFDGSDLGMEGLQIDAFAFAPDGSLVMSFTRPAGVPGIIGTVDDSDLVRFDADSLGADTEGSFSRYFDGSDVGLTTDDEDIDALDIRASGQIIVSTTGTATVPGVAEVDDSDLLRFTPSSIGGSTAGSWVRHFDGSDVGLTTGDEDIDAVAAWDGLIGLSSTGELSVPGLDAHDEDVSVFEPSQLGSATDGDWLMRLIRGATIGLGDNDVTGLEVDS